MDDRPETRDGELARRREERAVPDRASPEEARAPRDAPASPASERPAAPPRRQADVAERRPGLVRRLFGSVLRLVMTALVLAAAAIAALVIWDAYVTAPWTRDGRIRVQVASIAPQVSGQITEVRIVDNQYVHRGDVLVVIDPFDFQNALEQAKAQVRMRAADLQVKRVQAERRQHLTNLATTAEEQQQYEGAAVQAEAAFKSAQAQQAQAEINLARTSVRSPVNGYITNLQLRVGDYAHEGTAILSVIDADSFWVDGYFEETKLAHVCVGDRAEAELMGYRDPIKGVVSSVTRGIAVSDAAASTQGLPNVDPVYTWVRLAQRVPVRIDITEVPPGIPLVSGMTATVTVRDPAYEAHGPWWQQRVDDLRTRLATLFDRPAPRPDCVPAIGNQKGTIVTLPTPEPSPKLHPSQINPGLVPGLTEAPAGR